jgi:hypothetical protein
MAWPLEKGRGVKAVFLVFSLLWTGCVNDFSVEQIDLMRVEDDEWTHANFSGRELVVVTESKEVQASVDKALRQRWAERDRSKGPLTIGIVVGDDLIFQRDHSYFQEETDSEGNEVEVEMKDYITTRTISFQVQVIEGAEKRVLMQGDKEISKSRVNSYNQENWLKGGVHTLVEILDGPDSYPEPASMDEMIESFTKVLMNTLPTSPHSDHGTCVFYIERSWYQPNFYFPANSCKQAEEECLQQKKIEGLPGSCQFYKS